MDFLYTFADFILHSNVYLDGLIAAYGAWIYVILFAIIFLETGVVVTPFLPGDSLIFAAGAAAGAGKLSVEVLIIIFLTAAIIGDALNYAIGRFAGERLLTRYPRLIAKKHIERTEAFFIRYGGRAIILARFVPIVRTIAPFLAGAGGMTPARFVRANVVGAFLWVFLSLFAGYFLGGLSWVQENFSLVLLIVVILSFLPPVIEWRRERRKDRLRSVL